MLHPLIDLQQLATWRAAGQIHHLQGRRWFARRESRIPARPWLVLLHGFPTASIDWLPLWPALAQRFDLLAPDLLGFGDSDKPHPHAYRIGEQADLLFDLLEQHGISRCHVLAHDYGTTVAQEWLARQIDQPCRTPRLDSLLLLNGGLFPEAHRPRLIQHVLRSRLGPWLQPLIGKAAFARGLRAVFGPSTPPKPAEIDVFWHLMQHGQGGRVIPALLHYIEERSQQRARWVGALIAAKIPLRLINGSLDPVSGAHLARRYRELIADPDVVDLPAVGHYPQIEAPEAVLAAAHAFWDRNGAFN